LECFFTFHSVGRPEDHVLDDFHRGSKSSHKDKKHMIGVAKPFFRLFVLLLGRPGKESPKDSPFLRPRWHSELIDASSLVFPPELFGLLDFALDCPGDEIPEDLHP